MGERGRRGRGRPVELDEIEGRGDPSDTMIGPGTSLMKFVVINTLDLTTGSRL